MIPQIIINGLMLTITFALLSVALSVTYSIMGVINFSLGALSMLGAYAIYYLVVGPPHLNFLLALGIAFLMAGLLGLLMEKGFLWRLRNQFLTCIIITMALANAMQGIVSLATPGAFLSLPGFISGMLSAGGVSISKDRAMTIVIGALLILGVFFLIQRSKLGKAMRATSLDEEMASLQGVNVESVYLLGMFISCGLAGVVGGLAALVTPLTPTMGSAPLLSAFIVVILGGLGSLSGALLAAAVLGFMNSFVTTYFGAMYASVSNFAVLILILAVRPKGLLGAITKHH